MKAVVQVCAMVLPILATVSGNPFARDGVTEKRMFNHPLSQRSMDSGPHRQSKIHNIPPLRRIFQNQEENEPEETYSYSAIDYPPLQASRIVSLPVVQSPHAFQVSRIGGPQAMKLVSEEEESDEEEYESPQKMRVGDLLKLLEEAAKARSSGWRGGRRPYKNMIYGFV